MHAARTTARAIAAEAIASMTFGQTVDAIAPDLAGIQWPNAAIPSPGEILTRYAVPVELGCLAPHRQYSEAELLERLDAIGAEVVATDGGYAVTFDGAALPRRFRTVAGAALHGLTQLSPQTPVCARATAYFAVAPWLAYQLEQRGEIMRHTAAGVSVWAACGTDGEATDDNPLLRDIFALAVLRIREAAA